MLKFEYVNYTAFVADEEMNLYDAINCNHGTYITKALSSNSDKEDKPLILTFDVILF